MAIFSAISLGSCSQSEIETLDYIQFPEYFEPSPDDAINIKTIDKLVGIRVRDTTLQATLNSLNEVFADSAYFYSHYSTIDELAYTFYRGGESTKRPPVLTYITSFPRNEKIHGDGPFLFSTTGYGAYSSKALKVYVFAQTSTNDDKDYKMIVDRFSRYNPDFYAEVQPFVAKNFDGMRNFVMYFSVDTVSGKVVAIEDNYLWTWNKDLGRLTISIPNESNDDNSSSDDNAVVPSEVLPSSTSNVKLTKYVFVKLKVAIPDFNGSYSYQTVCSSIEDFEEYSVDIKYRLMDLVQNKYLNSPEPSAYKHKIVSREAYSFDSYEEASKAKETALSINK